MCAGLGAVGRPMLRNFGNSCAFQSQGPLRSVCYRVFGEKKSVCKGVLVLFPIKILGIKSKGRKRARE